MKSPGPLKRVALILLLVILLPSIFFTAFQISALSGSERLMSDMYRRQLDAVLYSVNQYALDVVNSWVNDLSAILGQTGPAGDPAARVAAGSFCNRLPSLRGVFLTDSALTRVDFLARQSPRSGEAVDANVLLDALRANREKIDRLATYRRAKYRKLEPVALADRTGNSGSVALTFSAGPESTPSIGGIVLDDAVFVRDVLSRKLEDAAGDEFILGILREDGTAALTMTSPVPADELKQRKAIWLLPGEALGIRLKGATIDELVSRRSRESIILVTVLDLLLLAGAVVVYLNMRREMELTRIKSDFVSNVSHELRTPLALIRMYAETLEMGRLNDETKKSEYYATILHEAERLTRLVNNILNFSSMEAGKKQFHFSMTNVNEIVAGVMRTYSGHLRVKGFAPILDTHDALPDVLVDSEAVAEALINIIDNAVKYSESDKYLCVRSGLKDRHVFLEIEDHGIGIPQAQQRKIFDMFYRVESGPVHDRKGTGIGLSLVQTIMHAHGGAVSVRSSPGKGSTFRLAFPVPGTESHLKSRPDDTHTDR